jgi:hypothetical protein
MNFEDYLPAMFRSKPDSGMLKTLVKQADVPGAAPLARRPAQLQAQEAAALGAPVAPQPAPARMTPQQAADWQAVGMGQMKLGEYRQKHGFLPN